MRKKQNQDQDHDTYKFLRLFREEDEDIVIVLAHENPDVENKMREKFIHLPVKLKDLKVPPSQWILKRKKSKYFIKTQNAKHGKAVFFIVNPGGTKNEEITGVRAYFADVDMAKSKYEFDSLEKANVKLQELENTGKYEAFDIDQGKKKFILRARFKSSEIEQLKSKFLKKNQRELKDAVINETFAGFHVYWRTSNISLDRFSSVQHMIAHKFGGDNQVSNAARMMRINGFIHQKYPNPFEVKVIQWSDRVFTESELIAELDLQEVKQTKGHRKTQQQEKVSFGSDLTRSVNVTIKQSKDSDLEFKKPVKLTEKMAFNDCLDEIMYRPLSDFLNSPVLQVGNSLHCPFHHDKHPSASVFRSSEGKELFHCHACEVGTKDVIGLYMRHTGKKFINTVHDLGKVLGIKIIETDYEREQFVKYRLNRLYLEHFSDELFPFTDRYIRNRDHYLRFFNDKGEVSVGREEFQYKNENVFFVSFRAVAKEMRKKSMKTVQNAVNLLNVLGFIERVPENCVPDVLKSRAERERAILQEELRQQGEKGEKRAEAVRLINFYIVPNWNDRSEEIEAMAKLMKESKFTFTTNMNKTGLTKLLGKEIADRVFPDGRVVSNRFQAIESKLSDIIKQHLDAAGYCILDSVVNERVRVSVDGKRIELNVTEKQDVLKRAMPSILADLGDGYEVKKVRSKVKQKQLFGITSETEIIAVMKKAVQ